MNEKQKAFRIAFTYTLPVLTGFSVLGIAYGILMSTKGFGVIWTSLISGLVFAGSMQYVAIYALLTTAFNPIYALFLTLMVNARHLFYGISMLNKYKGTKKFKPFLIFGLCDETFSILCLDDYPKDINKNWFMFFVTLLNYLYWVIASVIGSLIGSFINFNIKGLDFVLTALFVVIFLNQLMEKKEYLSAIIGVLSSVITLLIFGSKNFLIPAMIIIITILITCRKYIVKEK